LAVEPHSISTVPFATRGRRVAYVTGLYLTLRFGMAFRLHRLNDMLAQLDREADRLQLVVKV